MSGGYSKIVVLTCLLSACTHTGSITRTSAAYNKAMADVRNEQLLLNIIRAAVREPLQFSAMGEITTTFDRSAGLDSNFNNFIAGGADAVTQVLKLGGGNKPVVKITPLSNKEFIAGMLQPTTPETLKRFMDLGWDAEFMLPLLIRGYRCPGAPAFTELSGTNATLQDEVTKLSKAVHGAYWSTVSTPGKSVKLQVPDDKALEMLRSGVAAGYKVETVTPGPKAGTSIVKLTGPESKKSQLRLALCPRKEAGHSLAEMNGPVERQSGSEPLVLTTFTVDEIETDAAAASLSSKSLQPGEAKGQLLFRSVEGVIYFLGQRLRRCLLGGAATEDCSLTYSKTDTATNAEQSIYLLRVLSRSSRPVSAAVKTHFYGSDYWISRLDPADVDRTVKTFSFLNQLIALQTEASATGTTQTVLTVGN